MSSLLGQDTGPEAMLGSSVAVLASLVGLTVLSLALAILAGRKYLLDKTRALFFWTVGLALVFVTVAEEALLYWGTWSQLLIQSYVFFVAALVGVLSLGSAELSLSYRLRLVYGGYIVAATVLMGVLTFTTTFSSSVMLQSGVVTGLPPTLVQEGSILLTVPGALLMIIASLLAVIRKKRWNMLYIATGAIVLSASGSLYVASAPVTLYYGEFIGIFLLFLGFINVPLFRSEMPLPIAGTKGS